MKLLLIAMALVVAGCVTDQQVWQQYAAKCNAYGYTQGTDAFAHCMQIQDQNKQSAYAAYVDRYASDHDLR